MVTILWALLGIIIFNLFMAGSFYFSAHSQDSSYRKGSKMIQIKHFKKLCSFKNKDEGVVEYCYKMQVYSVIQFIVLIIIAIGFVLYEYASGNYLEGKTIFITGFLYTMISGLIMVMWSLSGEAKYQSEKRKQRKKKNNKGRTIKNNPRLS